MDQGRGRGPKSGGMFSVSWWLLCVRVMQGSTAVASPWALLMGCGT